MTRTFIRQETQIRNSDAYDDTVTPSVANYETNPTHIQGDLNNLRSQIQNILNRNGASFPTGDWFSDMTAPGTFENGIKRGVDKLNLELHELERKRVLVKADKFLTDIVVGVSATGTLTNTGNFANTETVTTGTKTYQFQTVLTNVDGNVLIGASASDSLDNLIAAINLGAGSGTLYAAATVANTFVSAVAGAGDTMIATARTAGAGGNAIATTETSANASWGAATLAGGSDTANFVVLSSTQNPTNTTVAVGAVSTRGTVAAFHAGTFGTHSLDEVVGSSSISPKNLCEIIDSVTHDPILSGGRVIYALFQVETNTDAQVLTGVTPNRAQLSFVRLNSAGSDLEAVPNADIGGLTIHYAAAERKALEDLNEQDFLRGAVTDISAAASVNRQTVYNAQGTTVVEVTTNSTLDINNAGSFWKIRDLANADLFTITEGSTGGTSTLQFGTDVDTFDNNAIDNDFATGAKFATGGVEIDIAKTIIANTATIESIGAGNDLRILGSRELFLDDVNQTGSTWAQTNGIKLSDTTGEWDTFETLFGEVSLLNAIAQAKSSDRKPKVYANLTTNTSADTDVGGVAGGANLDTQLPDLSLGAFLTDYDVYLNGELLRPGANAAANHDYYPGTSLANGQLKFEFTLKAGTTPDVICVAPYK
jgi:hypothetical protein